ncbi:MAG: lysophospholipid acyltransferase family protein [Bacteriovoracia bacterium]
MLKRFLQILNQVWAVITIPIVFIVLVTPATLLAIPFGITNRLRIVGPFWKLFGLYTVHFGCWAKVYYEDRRQTELRAYPPTGLYIANHQSFMDIPLALTQFQIPPIMKKEVLYLPLLGLMGWAAGALVVSRRKRDSRKKVFVQAKHRLVNEKFALQYYPEGTRNRLLDEPKPFSELKVTLMHLAFEGGVPVVPVSIYGTRGVLEKSGMINPGKKIAILTRPALFPKDYPDANTFARACWGEVIKGHAELQAVHGS